MVKEQTLSDTDLLWTNERIFPNTKKASNILKKVLKKKVVRQEGWKRYDQLPGPVRKLIEAEGYKVPDRRSQAQVAAQGGQEMHAPPPPMPPPPPGGAPPPVRPSVYPPPPPPPGGPPIA